MYTPSVMDICISTGTC